MKHPVLKSGLSLILLLSVLAACRKDVIETQYTRLEGKWKLTKTALDDNADGVIQGNEVHPIDTAINDVIQFKKDSSGVETVIANGLTTNYTFRYTIDPGNIIHRIGVGYDTINYYLASISSSDLELTTNAPSGLAAYFYQRR